MQEYGADDKRANNIVALKRLVAGSHRQNKHSRSGRARSRSTRRSSPNDSRPYSPRSHPSHLTYSSPIHGHHQSSSAYATLALRQPAKE